MIIEKTLSLSLDIHDVIGLYTDLHNNLMQILVDRYEGRCYAGCHISKVNTIHRVGECVINQDGSPTFGTIPVICTVTAVVFACGEVINACVVKNKDKATGALICDTPVASIIVNHNPVFESITTGQIISTRVVDCRYVISSRKISVSAVHFTFSVSPAAYQLAPATPEDIAMLSDVLERIKYEEAEAVKMKATNAQAWSTFNQLLYAYQAVQPPPSGATVVDIKTLLATPQPTYAWISRDNRLDLSTSSAYVYDAPPFPNNVRAVTGTPGVHLHLFEDYCAHLRTIREMVETYSTDALITSHRNLWQCFRKTKIG
jgi:hypothetical protein